MKLLEKPIKLPKHNSIMKAIIPAAGLGTEFLPATKAQPTEMLPVYDKPSIQYVVEEAIASGIDDIIVITGRNKRSIEDHFDKSYELEYTLQKAGKDRDLKKIRQITNLADITYVRQKEYDGLGSAIKCGQRHVEGDAFAVLLGDYIAKGPYPCTGQLIDVYNKYNSSVVSLKDVPPGITERYGIVGGESVEKNVMRINELVEKPKRENSPSNLAIMGRYVLTPDIFDRLDETERRVGEEFHLTHALAKLDSLYGVNFTGNIYNISNKMEWLKTSIDFALDDDEFKGELVSYMKSYI